MMLSLGYYLDFKFNIKKVSLLICLFFFFGCSLFKPELTRRYDKALLEPQNAGDKFVTVSAFTMDQPAATKKDLADSRGTSALIMAIGAKAKDIKELRSNLGEFEIIPKKEEDINKTTFKKRIVFAVDKEPFKLAQENPNENFGLADRINDLTVKLTIINKGVRFASWNRFITEEESVDLGTITATKKGEASLQTEVGAMGTVAPVKLTPTVTASHTLEEEVALKQRRIKLSGKFLDNGKTAVLRQEGAVGKDLTGTFIVDVDIKPDEGWRTIDSTTITGFSLPAKNAKASDAAKLSLKVTELKYLGSAEPITCELKYDYRLRHAKSDRIIAEGYQNVIFFEGRDVVPKNKKGEPMRLTLVKSDELKARVYRIEDRQYPKMWVSIKKINGAKTVTRQLGFSSFTEANDFLDWLKEKDDNIKSFLKYEPFIRQRSNLEEKALQKQDIINLRVQLHRLNYEFKKE